MAFTRAIILISVLIGISYCQTYGDGNVQAEFEVKCSDTAFAIFFNKTALDERTLAGGYNNRSYVIRFDGTNDLNCWAHDYDTTKVDSDFSGLTKSAAFGSQILIGTEFSTRFCGINVFSDSTHIIYNTTIVVTYGKNPNSAIGREEYDKYNVMCLRNRTVEEKLNGDKFDVDYRQTGEDAKNATSVFDFSLDHADIGGTKQSTYNLGDFIKFSLTLSSLRSVKGVIQKCWATSDGTANQYSLINDRCTLEEGTSWFSTPSAKSSVFKTEAFRYLGVNTQAVYIECLVRVCLASNTADNECKLCAMKRKRREVTDEETNEVGQMTVVKSPIFYVIDKDSSNNNQEQSSSGVLSGSNGLIVIILLASLVFVIAAAVIKKFFFNTPVVASPVVAYANKAMA